MCSCLRRLQAHPLHTRVQTGSSAGFKIAFLNGVHMPHQGAFATLRGGGALETYLLPLNAMVNCDQEGVESVEYLPKGALGH